MGTTKCCWTDNKKPSGHNSQGSPPDNKESKKASVKKRPAPPPPHDSSEKRKSETSFHTLDPVMPVVLKETSTNGRHEDLTDLTSMQGKPMAGANQFSQPVSLQDKQDITYAKIDKSKKGQWNIKYVLTCK